MPSAKRIEPAMGISGAGRSELFLNLRLWVEINHLRFLTPGEQKGEKSN